MEKRNLKILLLIKKMGFIIVLIISLLGLWIFSGREVEENDCDDDYFPIDYIKDKEDSEEGKD